MQRPCSQSTWITSDGSPITFGFLCFSLVNMSRSLLHPHSPCHWWKISYLHLWTRFLRASDYIRVRYTTWGDSIVAICGVEWFRGTQHTFLHLEGPKTVKILNLLFKCHARGRWRSCSSTSPYYILICLNELNSICRVGPFFDVAQIRHSLCASCSFTFYLPSLRFSTPFLHNNNLRIKTPNNNSTNSNSYQKTY